MRKFAIALLSIFITVHSPAQTLMSYSGSLTSDLSFNSISPYGNDFLAFGNQDNKLVVTQLSPSGSVIASNNIALIDENKTPVVLSSLTDDDGMAVICGYRGNIGDVSTYEAFMIRYNFANNQVIWTRVFKAAVPYGDYFTKVLESSPGGDYLACGSTSTNANSQEGIIYRFKRSNGAVSIITSMNLAGSADDFNSFVKDGNNLYTFGRYNPAGGGFDEMRGCISAFTQTGSEAFTNAYIRDLNDPARLYGIDLVMVKNNLYTISSGDGSGILIDKDLYFSKVNKHGTLKFTKKIEFPATDHDGKLQSIKGCSDGIIVLGNKYDAGSPNLLGDAFIVKIDTSGNIIWAFSYPFTCHRDGSGNGCMVVSGNYIMVVGRAWNSITGHYEGAMMKVDVQTGSLFSCSTNETVLSLNEPLSTTPLDMVATGTVSQVLGTFTSVNSETLTGTQKCSIGLLKEAEAINSFAVYPNPVTTDADITFSITGDSHASIILFDVTGKEVEQILDENEDAGTYQIKFSVRNASGNSQSLTAGIYFLQLKTGDIIETRKIVIE